MSSMHITNELQDTEVRACSSGVIVNTLKMILRSKQQNCVASSSSSSQLDVALNGVLASLDVDSQIQQHL